MMVNAKHKQASDIIRRGTYRKSYFKYSSKFGPPQRFLR